MSIIVDKPWGKEIIFTTEGLPYTGKIIYLNAGHRWSLQYHDQKTETFVLFQGEAVLTSGPDQSHLQTTSMALNQGFTITPNTIHRIEAITDSVIIEASTSETGTTFRLQDDYHRPHETEQVRSSPNRGWQL